MTSALRPSLLLALGAVLFIACGGEEAPPDDIIETPTKLMIAPAIQTLEPGATVQFTARRGGQSAEVLWSASVGTIDSTGLFTAPGHGVSSTITAVLKTDAEVTASLTVLAKDTRPPTVVLTSPRSASSGVGVMSAILVEFDEELDVTAASSMTASLTPLEQAEMVSSPVQVRVMERSVTVSSPRPLRRDAEISMQLSGVRDVAGNTAPPVTLTFHTRAGTVVSQDVTGSVSFTEAGSPYVLDPNKVIHLTASSTLELEAGAVVIGNLVDDGQATLRALGTSSAPVTFWNGWLRGSASSTHEFRNTRFHVFNPGYFLSAPTSATATYENCVIDWMGSPLAIYGDVAFGAGSMTGCHLKSARIALYGKGGTFRRNYLEGMQVILGPNHFNPSVFENNYLKGGSFSVGPQGTNSAVHGNSFIGLTGQVYQGSTGGGNDGRSGGTFDFTGNYWGTNVERDIDALILDSADDSAANYTITWKPFLTTHAAETPMVPLAL
ncbi:Ig-like domain-containing protein [Pyxidicoccus parkwayensis]|uniref:Ig-like domain-containing protein n=1 Tax=Pyxidicoccus parkwayensis TaxID=2813578 RepID=A0ABX7P4Y4_9BACT|nr:Ig-like domain-containing protein [Pyxidicoccus parkwaysis]QSQ25503.1 Ig-like domain-containing protein [Pyxidicoccus parkwaysis]